MLDKARMFCYTVVVVSHPPPQLIARLQERTPHLVGFFRCVDYRGINVGYLATLLFNHPANPKEVLALLQ